MSKVKFFILNLITILFLTILPYVIFGNKLFIGGDDTRLFYIYPLQWMQHISFYSWYHFSSYGSSNPNQFILPLLGFVDFLNLLFKSKVFVDYLFFSLPLILGLLSFQWLLHELVPENKYQLEFIIAAFFYVLSPILIINQFSVFLYPVWLIGGIPLFLVVLIKYVKSGSARILFSSTLIFLFLAIAFASIPWFLGFLLSAFIPLLFLAKFYTMQEILVVIKRFIIFIGTLLLSQAYWVVPFCLNFLLSGRGSFSSTILSSKTGDTFSPTVLATATGNILYPVLNLFHRDIAFAFNWPLKDTFLSLYDKMWYIDLFYVFILGVGLLGYKKYLQKYKLIYLYSLIGFILSLFFFTVNIDILKNVFLLFGHIPGFVMFRNFFDKFAFGFVFFYSLLFAVSLVIFNIRFKLFRYITNSVLLLIIVINILPIKQLINKPLWTTKNIYSVITIPQEYTDFVKSLATNIKTSSNLLSLPYNIAAYTFVKDKNTNDMFIGTSPIGIFTGLNDFSGDLSFAGTDSATFKGALLGKNYDQIQSILHKYAINYIFVTNNIPQEVKNSYLFEPKILAAQDGTFIASISGKLILSSTKGNYQLYTVKDMTPLISGKDVTFQKLSPVKFRVTIKNLKGNEALTYRDTYNGDWKLFPEAVNNVMNCTVVATYADYATSECPRSNSFTFAGLRYFFEKSIPDTYHQPLRDFGNTWTVSEAYIEKNFSKDMYTSNKDGSMNITFTLYFVPQTYFYIGTLISALTFVALGGYVLYDYRKRRKK